MKKKISIILISTFVLIISAMMGSNGVLAVDQLPLECTGDNFTAFPISSIPGEFPRQAEAGECGVSNGWIWEYIVTAGEKELNALTKIHVYVPSLPLQTIKVFGAEHIFARGEGGVSTPFGEGIYNGIVISVTPVAGANDTSLEFSFCTDINTTGTISVLFDTGRNEIGCAASAYDPDDQGLVGGIIGPGFGPSQFAVLETDKRIQLGSDPVATVCAKKHPTTGCIKYFYSCDDTNQSPVELASQPNHPFITDGEIVDMGNLEDPLCREAIFARKGSPVQYWGFANGKYYCIGIYDPSIPKWTPAPCK